MVDRKWEFEFTLSQQGIHASNVPINKARL